MAVDKKLSKAGLGYTIGNVLVRGIGFLTIPIFARLMSASDYGIYNTYTAYESILFILLGLALHTSFKNAYIKFRPDFDQYVSLCVLEAVVNLMLFLSASAFLYGVLGIERPNYVYLLFFHGFGSAVISYYNAYLGLSYRSREYVKLSLLIAVGNVALSALFMVTVFDGQRGFARILGAAFPTIVASFYLVYQFWRRKRPAIRKEFVKFSLRYSLPLIPHGVSQVLLSTFDRIMITFMVGEAQTGIYGFAYHIYSIIAVFFSSMDQVWSPWFYEKMSHSDYKAIRSAGAKYMRGTAYLLAGILLVSPEIVTILGSKEYYDSIFLIVPITIGGYFSFLYGFPAIIEYYFEKTHFIAIATFLSACLNIALNYVCIQAFGYQAAAYTTLATYVIYFLAHYWISVRLMGKNLYSVKELLITVSIVLAVGALTQMTLSRILLRWILAVLDAAALLWFLNREFGVQSIIKRKLKLH